MQISESLVGDTEMCSLEVVFYEAKNACANVCDTGAQQVNHRECILSFRLVKFMLIKVFDRFQSGRGPTTTSGIMHTENHSVIAFHMQNYLRLAHDLSVLVKIFI